MGRELRRVPEKFTWPINRMWFGFSDCKPIACKLCIDYKEETDCILCGGEKRIFPIVPIPTGDWYQVWETVSEGSPVSPAFATAQELVFFLVTYGDPVWGRWELRNAEKFVSAGYVPSFRLAVCQAGTIFENGINEKNMEHG
jgi:hypothetical protein